MSADVQLKSVKAVSGADHSAIPANPTDGTAFYGHNVPYGDKYNPAADSSYTNAAYQSDENDVNDRKVKVESEKKEYGDEVEQYEESSDDDDDLEGRYARGINKARVTVIGVYDQTHTGIWIVIGLLLATLYFVYFGFAVTKTFDVHSEPAVRLLVLTIVLVLGVIIYVTNNLCCKGREFDLLSKIPDKVKTGIFWTLTIGTALFVIIFVAVDLGSSKRSENLISGLGMIIFILILFIFSKNPAKVNWRPVFWGLALQFYLALFILRTDVGFYIFNWLGDRVNEFLAHTNAGSGFVFGYLADSNACPNFLCANPFGFKVLPVIIFFSSVVAMLYYIGAMQVVIRYLARFLSFCLGTSPTESLSAAGNIFIGQTEAPLLIRPFLKDMTRSEMHAVCTGGFATIAGAVMAAYIDMGVSAPHLLSASVMSAPAALAMSKLFYPETKKSKTRAQDVYNIASGTESNIVEAASNGASVSISLIANIVVNLIAFTAILEFLNRTLKWFGYQILWIEPEHEELSFELICSYLFYPIAWLIGVSNVNCDIRIVSRLISLKTILNEFIAYAELAKIQDNTKVFNAFVHDPAIHNLTVITCRHVILGDGTMLEGGILGERSTVLATYALCGFSNLASIGIQLGALSAMAPSRKRDLTRVIIRAMIAGNVACFMTACISGLLYTGPP